MLFTVVQAVAFFYGILQMWIRLVNYMLITSSVKFYIHRGLSIS